MFLPHLIWKPKATTIILKFDFFKITTSFSLISSIEYESSSYEAGRNTKKIENHSNPSTYTKPPKIAPKYDIRPPYGQESAKSHKQNQYSRPESSSPPSAKTEQNTKQQKQGKKITTHQENK
ncbi:hypothetical protein M9H77_21621 [Catharanthus roseus]|uniref:Uncharacterized protein n=1 Tax=Catharanthus roseus TaxID=4058 RepID=A0ACC0AQT0_CATRO|nr:hypothetical protein M9H77_21621 [Catharanthus roseus]